MMYQVMLMTNSREKGAAAEREVANILKEWGYEARRGQQFSGGSDSPDVLGLPGYHIEVKRTERTDIYGWLEQSKRDNGNSENVPVVVHRKNKEDWVVILSLTDFLTYLAERSFK